jgi:hypothetical protein
MRCFLRSVLFGLAVALTAFIHSHAVRVHCGVAHTTDYKTQNVARVCGAYVEVSVWEYEKSK